MSLMMANCRPKYLRSNMWNIQRDRQYTDKTTVMRVRVLIIAVEQQ